MWTYAHVAQSQSLNPQWQVELQKELDAFLKCENTNSYGINTCNRYIGQSLKTVYNINDFYSKSKGRYMRIVEIANFLENSKSWTSLGKGYEAEVLSQAQKNANKKQAVVAIYFNEAEKRGNIALILPGTLKNSGSWGLKVPNCAALFINEPKRSFVNKGLSYAFRKSTLRNVILYTKNY